MTAPFADLEAVYERLALAIDQCGPDKSEIMLAKVILLLASRLDRPTDSLTAIETALKDL